MALGAPHLYGFLVGIIVSLVIFLFIKWKVKGGRKVYEKVYYGEDGIGRGWTGGGISETSSNTKTNDIERGIGMDGGARRKDDQPGTYVRPANIQSLPPATFAGNQSGDKSVKRRRLVRIKEDRS